MTTGCLAMVNVVQNRIGDRLADASDGATFDPAQPRRP